MNTSNSPREGILITLFRLTERGIPPHQRHAALEVSHGRRAQTGLQALEAAGFVDAARCTLTMRGLAIGASLRHAAGRDGAKVDRLAA